MNQRIIRQYWYESRQFATGVALVAPLWLVYELSAFVLNDGFSGRFRSGVDYLFRLYWSKLDAPAILSACIPALLLILVFLKKSNRAQLRRLSPHHWALMLLESMVIAAVFGIIVGGFSSLFLTAGWQQSHETRMAALVINLGSGVFEELVFRVILLGGCAWLLGRVSNRRAINYAIAVVFNSLAFAMFHYIDYFDEPFTWSSFLFRFVAGGSFSLLFLLRGYGITAYTHSFYNIFLLFR